MAANGKSGVLDAQPWVEKFRPKTLDDVAAHKDIIDTSELAAHDASVDAPFRFTCRSSACNIACVGKSRLSKIQLSLLRRS